MRQIGRERRIKVAEALRELLAVANLHRNVDEVLGFVLERATELLGSDAGLIYLFDADRDPDFLHIAAARGLSTERIAPRIRIGSPVSGMAFRQRRPVAFHDLLQVLRDEIGPEAEPLLEDRKSHLVVRRIGSLLSESRAAESLARLARTHPAALAVPLIARDQTYGSLALFYTEPIQFSSEMVDLASAFANQAALVIENTRLHRQAEQRAEELEMLYEADALLHRSLRLRDVLEALCNIAAGILAADKTVAWTWDEARQHLAVGGGYGLTLEFRAQRLAAADIAGIAAEYAREGIVIVEDVQSDPKYSAIQRERDTREGVRAWIGALIRTGDQLFGSLAAGYANSRTFSEQDRRVVRALAQRAALAIQNARLFEHSQEMATLQERQRLARDLHDSVTQTLYAISIYTETAGRALADGNSDAAAANVRDARDATQEALAEMRQLIHELRPALLEEYGLIAALRARLSAVETRTGLVADLETERDERLAPEAEQELYRIAQEALNNVMRHAQAKQVHVRLWMGPETVTLEVADDGVGFDPSSLGIDGLGLPGMRERAARLQGTLQVESRPGAGTRVRIEVPR